MALRAVAPTPRAIGQVDGALDITEIERAFPDVGMSLK